MLNRVKKSIVVLLCDLRGSKVIQLRVVECEHMR